MEILELSALLHDIADSKYGGTDELQRNLVTAHLASLSMPKERIETIIYIISNVSFRKELGNTAKHDECIELSIVKDADKIDALGAIGIARCMVYSGAKGRPIYDPSQSPLENITKEQYEHQTTTNTGTAINHFHEKLFKLRDLMITSTGKRLAEERHKFMLSYLEQFHDECKGLK